MSERAEAGPDLEATGAGRANLPQRESCYGGVGLVQGVFEDNRDSDCFIDTETGEAYSILGSIDYGLGKRAYQLMGLSTSRYVLIDQVTKVPVESARRRSR